MIAEQGNIPRNSQTPITDAELYAMDYASAARYMQAVLAKAATTCLTPAETMPSAGVASQARWANSPAVQGLIHQNYQLDQSVAGAQSTGAVIDDSDIAGAPEMVPFADLPSAQAPAARFPKARRRLRQPGTPWAVASAATVGGECAVPRNAREGIAERARTNPWGMLLLAVGAGLVIVSASSNGRR